MVTSPAISFQSPSPPPLPLDVLVVDDDQHVRGMLNDFLSLVGCRVDLTGEAQQALSRLEKRSFHVAIVDLKLPDMDGMTLVSQLRQRDRELAVIILTGYADMKSATDCVRLSASAYMEKPPDLGQLRVDLEQIARQRGLLVNHEEEVLRSLGIRIHERRRELGMRLRQLSELTAISVSMLSQIERASSSMSICSLVRIATALQVDVSELFVPLKPKR